MAQADVVLITGANTGIGYQIVRALASSEKAYDIIVAGRSLDKAQAAIDSAKAEFSSTKSKLYPLQVDLESDESINAAFEKVKTQFSRVDVLINNAGKVHHYVFIILLAYMNSQNQAVSLMPWYLPARWLNARTG
jgi:NAD(P)-dependent dehydrogenase (short-subunit alcohol dehydrogenase family)